MRWLLISPANLQGLGIVYSLLINSLGIQMESSHSSSRMAHVCAQVSPLTHGSVPTGGDEENLTECSLLPPQGPCKGYPLILEPRKWKAACPWASTSGQWPSRRVDGPGAHSSRSVLVGGAQDRDWAPLPRVGTVAPRCLQRKVGIRKNNGAAQARTL